MPIKMGLAKKREIYLKDKLREIVSCLKQLNPEKIILFGSLAKGKIHKASDVDLILVVEDVPPRFIDRLEKVYSILDTDFPIDILVYTPKEIEEMKKRNPFIRKALQEGIVLYERNP